MGRRTYDQYCPAARALDVVGERWALLLVRELLLGPKRYTDLLDGLPGIGPNVLAGRLKHLQAAGVVRRVELPPPAASSVYELTELGAGLRPVVLELARWGFRVMGEPRPDDRFRFGWLLTALQTQFDRTAARGVRETYEFRIDGELFHVRVDDGALDARHGPAPDAACRFECGLPTFLAVGAGLVTPAEAVAAGAATGEGDAEAARRSLQILATGVGEAGAILVSLVKSRVAEACGSTAISFELRLGDRAFDVTSSDGHVAVAEAHADRPAATLSMDLPTFLALGSVYGVPGREPRSRVQLEGDRAVAERALDLLCATPEPQQRAA